MQKALFGGFLLPRTLNVSILNYFKETRTELKHVTWPTVNQAVVYTIMVIAISIGVSLLLGFFDYLFSGFIQRFI
jgi:preprotein translocase subunit SecE